MNPTEEIYETWWNVHYENTFMQDNSLFVMQVSAPTREEAIKLADQNLMSYVLIPSNWEFIDCQVTEH
jgi:hypothetical protein